MMSFDDESKKRDRRSSFVAPESAKAQKRALLHISIDIYSGATTRVCFPAKGRRKIPYQKKSPSKKSLGFRYSIFLDEGRKL